MIHLPVVISGIAGTAAMTAYSFAVSELRNKNFKEPHLLGTMLRRLINTGNSKTSKSIGWVIHMGVGIALAGSYQYFSRKVSLEPCVPKGGLIGGITGIVGAIAWQISLQKHPYPPAVDRKRFYGQLIIAHVIFGIATVSLLQMFNRKHHSARVETTRKSQPIY